MLAHTPSCPTGCTRQRGVQDKGRQYFARHWAHNDREIYAGIPSLRTPDDRLTPSPLSPSQTVPTHPHAYKCAHTLCAEAVMNVFITFFGFSMLLYLLRLLFFQSDKLLVNLKTSVFAIFPQSHPWYFLNWRQSDFSLNFFYPLKMKMLIFIKLLFFVTKVNFRLKVYFSFYASCA